ncbi:MAG: hypothetical protein ACRDJW_22865 [Thermomicrobiales bacterium]
MRRLETRLDGLERRVGREATIQDIPQSPAWWAVRQAMVETLAAYPEAKLAVAARLADLAAAEDASGQQTVEVTPSNTPRRS